jgi:hypothetical protein
MPDLRSRLHYRDVRDLIWGAGLSLLAWALGVLYFEVWR